MNKIFSAQEIQKIGIFGGTFDPVHCGHLNLARAFLEECELDQVIFVPVGIAPHRANAYFSNADRVAFLRAATEYEPKFSVDEREILRTHTAYTVDTLQEFRDEFGEACALFFLMGMDSWLTFHTWHQWERILTLAHLVVAARPDYELASMPEQMVHIWRARATKIVTKQGSAGKILALSLPPLEVSATHIRANLHAGNWEHLPVPESVKPLIFNCLKKEL